MALHSRPGLGDDGALRAKRAGAFLGDLNYHRSDGSPRNGVASGIFCGMKDRGIFRWPRVQSAFAAASCAYSSALNPAPEGRTSMTSEASSIGVEGATLVRELLVPAEGGLAYEVARGQVQRVLMVDGPQVGDMAIFNASNYKETFDPDTSYVFNSAQGTGTDKGITYFYSRPPHLRVMFEVLEDRVGTHFAMNGSKCTAKRYELMGIEGYHQNCFDNLASVIAPYGLTPEDVPDVYNLFMHVGLDASGRYGFRPPTGHQGDYIDMRAEMDCLVALSACPAGDVTVVNGEGGESGNKRLKVEIWE